ncbi:MAG: class I SAM-dependent methyltransferase [Candidatus Glassbacteria bacterium]
MKQNLREHPPTRQCQALTEEVRAYWNQRIHDLEMTNHPPGSRGFFRDLDEYRFDKLRYLPRLVDFNAYRGLKVLEVGCGIGIDLARFARGGAMVTGIDFSAQAVELAAKYFEMEGLEGEILEMDGERMNFGDESFDAVYCHGVLQYAPRPDLMVRECHRVLKRGGVGIFMVYNKRSWLYFLSKVMGTSLEHEDAPVLRIYTRREFVRLLSPFNCVRVIPERFPVKTRLHGGGKGFFYNTLFVPSFNLLPRVLVRSLGWHLMAFGTK